MRLRKVALIALIAGAAASEGSMLFAGRHNPSRLVIILFALWMLSPFVGLLWLNIISKRWSGVTRVTLCYETLFLTLSSLAIYAAIAFRPPKAQGAFAFVVIPPASWLLILTIVPIVALISARKTRRGRRVFKGVAALATLGILVIGTLFGWLWLEQRAELTLPTPTGPVAVGRVVYTWADDTNFDPAAPRPGTKRELLVWVWYPAAGSSDKLGDYVPAQVRALADRMKGSGIFKSLTRNLSKVRAHSTDDADLSPRQQSYPVVIMRGGASAEVVNYTTLAEDLASHSYVVVGIDAPYRTSMVVFPDGRVITRTSENDCEERKSNEQVDCFNRLLAAWTRDMAFVLNRLEQLNTSGGPDKFKGRLDMTRVGVFGHSFGGAQAIQFCHDDPRCKAGIDIDGRPLGGVVQDGIHQPLMFLLSDHSRESDPESRQVKADMQSIYEHLPATGRLRISIKGANHFTFSDDGALLKSSLVRGVLRSFGKLGIDGRRQLAITAYCVRSFFDTYLKEESASRLKISSPLYPEIEVLE